MLSLIVVSSCSGQLKEQSKTGHKVEHEKIPVPKNGFSRAYQDLDGTLWFTSNRGGVYHYDGVSYEHYTEEDGLSSIQVFSIARDNKNNLWFGTQKGLTKYDRTKFEHIPLPYQDTSSLWLDQVYPMINPNAAYSLAPSDSGLWIGTTGGGAFHYDGEQFQSYLTEIGRKQEDSLYHNWVSYINKDREGNIWFASMTNGGVTQFDGKSFTHYSVNEGLADNFVRIIYDDNQGNHWFGFNGNRRSALTKFDGMKFKTYSIEDGLCHQQIRSFCEDNEGNLWIGADHGNLCIYDGETFSEFNYEGQSFSSVFFIFNDPEGNIWFGGQHGIWKYDGHTLTSITAID